MLQSIHTNYTHIYGTRFLAESEMYVKYGEPNQHFFDDVQVENEDTNNWLDIHFSPF